jgi:hypothetical protein
VALDLAREEVIALRKEELLLGRKVQFDPVTDWYLMAWDAFSAEEFPADEARKLAIVLGLDLERDIISARRVAAKKSADVVLQRPVARRKKGMVDDDVLAFDCLLDAVHTRCWCTKRTAAAPVKPSSIGPDSATMQRSSLHCRQCSMPSRALVARTGSS